ncbi:MAG: hypothetical protein M1828_003032 [Chrysothrix sp. TS-e1954]|nr:MAG: hypothetical protein M1828_003032 [Chrysothrix sp. TS-e1954]
MAPSKSNPNPKPETMNHFIPSTRASCYVADARTSALHGLHYSTTAAGGVECPPLAAYASASERDERRQGGAAKGASSLITEECERLFCGTLRAAFLGERDARREAPGLIREDSLGQRNDTSGGDAYEELAALTTRRMEAMGLTPPEEETLPHGSPTSSQSLAASTPGRLSTSSPEPTLSMQKQSHIIKYTELWDYTSNLLFRGFIHQPHSDSHPSTRTFFTFFTPSVLARDLKNPLMALLELADTESLACAKVVICLDRGIADTQAGRRLVRDLGWVGFVGGTLEGFVDGVVEEKVGKGKKEGTGVVSERWLFLGMDV